MQITMQMFDSHFLCMELNSEVVKLRRHMCYKFVTHLLVHVYVHMPMHICLENAYGFICFVYFDVSLPLSLQ